MVDVICIVLAALAPLGGFSFSGDAQTLTLHEGDRPVFTYIYGTALPEGIAPHYRRGGYIHPLYDLDGHALTEDFPSDHYHHRGVFWAWPQNRHGDRPMDIWHLSGVRSRFRRFHAIQTSPRRARLGIENIWSWDEAPDEPVVIETMEISVHPSETDIRILDFQLILKNVSNETVTLKGQDGSGYGGFNLRPDSRRAPLRFTTIKGPHEGDADQADTPWVDVTLSPGAHGRMAGVALFQHPENPDFPHNGWTIRHYGFLGAAYPHDTPLHMPPGTRQTFRYRLVVHRGSAEDALVSDRFDAYIEAAETR